MTRPRATLRTFHPREVIGPIPCLKFVDPMQFLLVEKLSEGFELGSSRAALLFIPTTDG